MLTINISWCVVCPCIVSKYIFATLSSAHICV